MLCKGKIFYENKSISILHFATKVQVISLISTLASNSELLQKPYEWTKTSTKTSSNF